MSHLTIAYFTSRKQPMIEWFFDALHRETGGNYENIRVVVVDFWFSERNICEEGPHVDAFHAIYNAEQRIKAGGGKLIHGSPKPTVWQGKYKLTKVDWFAASNARNTAVCLAPDGWIAFVDDVSVLMPGWYAEVRRAMVGDRTTVTCGAYRKVFDLVVKNGDVQSYRDNPAGHDNRFGYGSDHGAVPCYGNWMYGCSLVAPVEAFLSINGWPEAWCDGLSFEDCICGIMLEKQGYKFVYNRKMMTFESEELHAQLPVMKRSDYGVSPNDKSHAVLNAAKNGNGWHPNYFDEEGIRGLRQRVLAGEPFPIVQVPEHEWYTSTPLRDLA
jgi:hypothetical protein